MKQRLLVDMDGVLSDVYAQFMKYEKAEFGSNARTLESLRGLIELDAFQNARKYIHERGFFRTMPVIEGSIDALKKLNTQYELFIVSSATEFPKSLEEKYDWLREHFSFISWKQMVFCGVKTMITGDIMIDDHFKNLDAFPGETILFTQPHNYFGNDKTHRRVHNWAEILTII